MRTFRGILIIAVTVFGLFAGGVFAEQEQAVEPTENPSRQPLESPERPHNVEIVIQDNTGTEISAWTGQIFSIKDGKPIDTISPQNRLKQLPAGNYVLILHFEEDVPELKGHRPFTFTLREGHKTTFTLLIGASQEPELEYDVKRVGADFIASDPRSGKDYVNFELPVADPQLCLAACKKDPNCDVFSYGNPPEWPKARCWLIHGAAVAEPAPHSASGVVRRDSSPYRVQVTIEKQITPEKGDAKK